MSSGINEKQEAGLHRDDQVNKAGADVLHDEVLVNANLMNDAVNGENIEHEMSMWAAVKTHPWACLWAFTMCFTIVCLLYPPLFAELQPLEFVQNKS